MFNLKPLQAKKTNGLKESQFLRLKEVLKYTMAGSLNENGTTSDLLWPKYYLMIKLISGIPRM